MKKTSLISNFGGIICILEFQWCTLPSASLTNQKVKGPTAPASTRQRWGQTQAHLIFYNPGSKTDEESQSNFQQFNKFFFALDFNRLTLILKMIVSASNLICCLWSMDLKQLLLSTVSVSWEVNWWQVSKIANLSFFGVNALTELSTLYCCVCGHSKCDFVSGIHTQKVSKAEESRTGLSLKHSNICPAKALQLFGNPTWTRLFS